MKQSRRLLMVSMALLLACGVVFAETKLATVSRIAKSAEQQANTMPAEAVTPLQPTFNAGNVLTADAAAAERQALRNPKAGTDGQQTVIFEKFDSAARLLKPIGNATASNDALPATREWGKIQRITNAQIVEGAYIAKDFVHGGSEINCVMTVERDANDSTMIHIHNFYGLEETVDAVIDINTGALTILPQRIWQSKDYGDVYLFPISFVGDKIQFYPQNMLLGSIDANGVIRLPQWGAIVGQGANAGLLLAAIDKSEYYPANATMTATKFADGSESQISYPLLLQQSTPYEITIYNFGTTGVPVKARIAPDKTVTVSPQFIVNLGLYGAFNCFPINGNSIDKQNPIEGLATENTMSFNAWVAGSVMQDGLVALWLTKSELTTAEGVSIIIPEASPYNFEGDGTASSPWLIKTAKDLKTLSEASQKNSFANKYFKQTADIDMSQVKGFIPIGSNKAAFNGNYDGDNHIISNLNIDGIGYHFQGLFGAIFNDAKISNIIIRRSSLTGSGYYLGLIAGYSQGIIENCRVQGIISGTGICVGGIVGRSYGAVRKSSFSGSASACGYVGGIVGYSYGEITACTSDADVSLPVRITNGAACVGGIAGLAQSYSVAREGKIADCYFSGTVTQGSGYGFAGGITGYLYACTVDRCFNTGSVAATAANGEEEQTGGISGIIRDTSITDCYNSGNICSAGSSKATGGLIGYITTSYASIGGMTEPVFVKNCYNSGQVLAKNSTIHAGVFGTEFTMEQYTEKPSDTAFTNVYTDNQSTGLRDTVYGQNTTFFTGNLPKGFTSQVWYTATGLYPVLKKFVGTEQANLSAATVTFTEGESTRVMKHNATLAAPAGINWYLLNNGELTDISNGLMKEGNMISLRNVYANDTVIAAIPGKNSGRKYLVNVVPKLFDGEGTAASPYLIKNKSDFLILHNAIMHYDHEGDVFLQTADVDFGLADDFSGVASGNHLKAFAGTFDGGNHRIKGLRVNSYITNASGAVLNGTYNYGGLFHIGTPTSVIRNVVIDKSCRFNFFGQSAPVIGYTTGLVENCRNYADVTSGTERIAGIVGYLDEGGYIRNCYNAGSINATKDYTAGIAGQNMGIISESQNDGDIMSAGKYAGGVVGASAGIVDFGVNSGSITGAEYVGGVIGSNSTGYNMGDVTNCFSSGIVVATAGSQQRGGVIGYSNGRSKIENNFYDASVNNMDGCSSLSSGFTAMATAELLTTTVPAGFNKDKFDFSSTAYPSLKAYADETVGKAHRSMFVRFEKGEKHSNVLRATELSSDPSIEWSLKIKENFSISNGKLMVVIPDTAVVADTLTAVYNNIYTKVIPLKSIPVILEGLGSENSPFLIKSANDINLLADFMEKSGMDYEGYHFLVENNIEYPDSVAFTPIALTGVQFQGVFNGNHKTISKFIYADENSKTGKNIGFFGTLGSKAIIHDLTLEGAIKAYSYAGSFAGLQYGRIENCESKSTVDCKSGYAGGFAGRMYDGSTIVNSVFSGVVGGENTTNSNYQGGFAAVADYGAEISGCVNKGTVGNNKNTTGTTYTGVQWVGGIAGDLNGLAKNCRNEGTVKGRMNVAGIAGRLAKTGHIFDCVNISKIEGVGSGTAGIFAKDQGSGTAEVRRCVNTGAISGKGYTGGIAGQIQSGIVVDSCYNTGAISAKGAISYGVGGVIGQMASSAKYPSFASNSGNSGTVYNECQSTGGFAGKITSGTVTDCYNTGDVTVNKEVEDQNQSGVGGFAGAFCATAERIWNSGNVVSNVPGAAGIFGTGAMPIAQVHYAVNFGDVTLSRVIPEKGYGAGGIWGGYGPSDISECYNYGTITAPDYVAGINAGMWSNGNGGSSIRRVYNAGKVLATAASPTAAANIANISNASDVDASLMKTDSVYYDKEICTVFPSDTIGKALTKVELMKAPLGNHYVYRTACMPTLAYMDSVPVANFHAVHIAFNNGDNIDNVNESFYVGILPHVVWSSSQNLVVGEDGVVYVSDKGDGWVKATTDNPESKLEKTFNLKLKTTGVNMTENEGKVVERIEYYTTNGLRVPRPMQSEVYFVKTVYTDGSCEIRKTIRK